MGKHVSLHWPRIAYIEDMYTWRYGTYTRQNLYRRQTRDLPSPLAALPIPRLYNKRTVKSLPEKPPISNHSAVEVSDYIFFPADDRLWNTYFIQHSSSSDFAPTHTHTHTLT